MATATAGGAIGVLGGMGIAGLLRLAVPGLPVSTPPLFVALAVGVSLRAAELSDGDPVATLELAVLYLEDGRTAEVKVIAAELTPIFAAQRVARETLASVKLFCQAVEEETVTAELARGWLQELRRVG